MLRPLQTAIIHDASQRWTGRPMASAAAGLAASWPWSRSRSRPRMAWMDGATLHYATGTYTSPTVYCLLSTIYTPPLCEPWAETPLAAYCYLLPAAMRVISAYSRPRMSPRCSRRPRPSHQASGTRADRDVGAGMRTEWTPQLSFSSCPLLYLLHATRSLYETLRDMKQPLQPVRA